jgi:cobalamin transport system substrate-binding protein
VDRCTSIVVLLLVTFATTLPACSRRDESVPVDHVARRIVSLSPPFTETIFALGRGDRLVGRSAYCDTPAAAALLPVVGDAVQVNIETLVSLEPDLIVTQGLGLENMLGPLRDRMRVRHIANESVEEVLASIATLGRIVEAEREATALIGRIRETIGTAEARWAGLDRPRVLVVVDRDPFYVASARSYVGALVSLAGGDNVVADLDAPYPTLSPETLVARAPDVLIDATPAGPEGHEEARRYWARFAGLPAVVSGRVYALQEMAVVRPGPRIPQALRALETLIHGEGER